MLSDFLYFRGVKILMGKWPLFYCVCEKGKLESEKGFQKWPLIKGITYANKLVALN